MVLKTRAGAEDHGADDACTEPDEPREPVDDFTLERVATYVTRFPGRTLAQVQHRLELSATITCNAVHELSDQGRVVIRRSTRTTVEPGSGVFLLTPETVSYWDDDVTRPLLEKSIVRSIARSIVTFPGKWGRELVHNVSSRHRPRKVLRWLRRHEWVETTWGLHGRRYAPSDALLAWFREVEGFTQSYENTPLGAAKALRDARRRYEQRQREYELELEQAREHERQRRRDR